MSQTSGNEGARIQTENAIVQLLGPSRLIPSGTITFLFTDIEGSTKLWELYPKTMGTALAMHDQILRSAIEQNGGYIFKALGDAFCAAFSTPADALKAAALGRRNLVSQTWDETGPLPHVGQVGIGKIRIGGGAELAEVQVSERVLSFRLVYLLPQCGRS